MTDKITENKQDSINNQRNSSILTRIETILSKITEHKEALGILGVVISVIVTALWNLGCDFGYMGYANKLNIPMMYIQKDYSSLLVQFLIISVVTFLVMLPIYKLAEYNSKKIGRHIITMLISLGIIGIPFILNVIFNAIESDNILVTSILGLTALFAIISILFFFLYTAVVLIFRFDNISNNIEKTTKDDKIHNENANNCNENATQTQAEAEKAKNANATQTQAEAEKAENANATQTQAEAKKAQNANVKEEKVVIKSLLLTSLWLALLSFLILIGVYATGWLIAGSKTNYRFLVEDLETDMKTGNMYHVILSETDTHYYLSESFIELDNSDDSIFIGDSKQITLHILTDFITVVEKSEQSFVREINFSNVEIR